MLCQIPSVDTVTNKNNQIANRMDRQEGEEEAMMQQAEPRLTPHPAARYKGVRMRKWGKWVAEARYPNSRERLWLGSYRTPEMAAMAYDAAVYCLRGPGEPLNFPGHPPNIPSANRLSRYEIRQAAVLHAEQAKLQEPEAGSAAGRGAGEGNTWRSGSASATSPGEPLQDLFQPASCGDAECFGFEGQNIWASADDVSGGNDDDPDGDMFGYFPLWNFQD